MAIPPRSPVPTRAGTQNSPKYSDPKPTGLSRPDINPPSSYHANSEAKANAIRQHQDSDLFHFETWITDEERRSIASLAEGPLIPGLPNPKR
jgi:hypothetical protein